MILSFFHHLVLSILGDCWKCNRKRLSSWRTAQPFRKKRALNPSKTVQLNINLFNKSVAWKSTISISLKNPYELWKHLWKIVELCHNSGLNHIRIMLLYPYVFCYDNWPCFLLHIPKADLVQKAVMDSPGILCTW